MTVTMNASDRIDLTGICPAEDAEILLQHLLAHSDAAIDWRGCETAHSAVVQVLMAARRAMLGTPAGTFIRVFVAPALARRSEFDLP